MKSMFHTLVVALTCALTALSACSPGEGSNKPVITVSIAPERYIVEQIVGDRYDIKTLLSQGANPESYEPSMAHLMSLEGSDAYLTVGTLPFEEAIINRIRNTNPDLEVIDLSEGIDIISGTHGHCGSHDHNHADMDPHTWSSVNNARIMAANALKALMRIDPKGAEYYQANYDNLNARLDSLDRAIRQALAPAIARDSAPAFIVWHPSLSYFARDYGLRQIALGADNKEMSPTSLRDRIDQARAGGAEVLLLQRDYDSRQAETAAKDIGAQVVHINPLSPDWAEELLNTARAIGTTGQK